MIRLQFVNGDRMMTRSFDAALLSQSTYPRGSVSGAAKDPLFACDGACDGEAGASCTDIAFLLGGVKICHARMVWYSRPVKSCRLVIRCGLKCARGQKRG